MADGLCSLCSLWLAFILFALILRFFPAVLPAFDSKCLGNAQANVASRPRPADAFLAEAALDFEVQITSKGTRAIAHLETPDDQLQLEGGIAKLVEDDRRLRIFERGGVRPGNFGQDLARFRDITIDRDADPNAKTHARVTMAPIDHRLFDKIGVRAR